MAERAVGGYTLIELMIAVTIVGILSAVAIPTYQRYTTRAKVSEGFVQVGSLKTPVIAYFSGNAAFPSDNASAAVNDPQSFRSPILDSVTIIEGGAIRATYRDPSIAGETLTLTPVSSDAGITWSCTSSMPRNLLPASCTAVAGSGGGGLDLLTLVGLAALAAKRRRLRSRKAIVVSDFADEDSVDRTVP